MHVGNYNKAGFDRTKWYSVKYETLNQLVARPSGQNGPTIMTKWPDAIGQNDPTNTRDYTEITTETTNNNILSPSSTAYPYKDVIDYLNQKLVSTTNQRLRKIKQSYVLEQMKVLH